MNSQSPVPEASLSSPAEPLAPQARPRRSWTVVLLLLAFSAGIGATLWLAPALDRWWSTEDGTTPMADNGAGPSGEDISEGDAATSKALTPGNVAILEARLAALSSKLDAISEQAAGAGGNAARAEGLLIAFATRRALDRGTPLGYLEGELRLRFGDAQPRAVATIITAAHSPITLADLQAGLEVVSPALLGTGGKADWWTAAKREISSLIVVRRTGEPSPVPQKAVERAHLLLSADRVAAALKEIERLPNHQKADEWIQMARQYNEARRALDVVEAAAILEPRSVPSQPRGGSPTNMQVAQPPPEVPAPVGR